MNDNHQHCTIELIGSYAARHVESGIENDQSNRRMAGTTRSPIPALCRDLIASGHNPNGLAHMVRKRVNGDGYMPIFKLDSTLRSWAAKDCVESEKLSVRISRFNPPPMATGANTSREEGRIAA